MKNLYFALFAVLSVISLNGQIVWTEPAFPTQDDVVVLYYDATEGNGEVAGVVPLYIHTGVITSNSVGPNDWQNVVGNWGTADANVVMSPEGNNVHSYDFNGLTLAEFYNLDAGEDILELAFVFRNTSGTLVGREADGSDIFFPISDGSFTAGFSTPGASSVAINEGDNLLFTALSSESSELIISVDGNEVSSGTGTEITYNFNGYNAGEYLVSLSADNGMAVATDDISVVVLDPNPSTAFPPSGTEYGINYTSDESVTLYLYAPYKENVFVVGDFNQWQFSLEYLMTKTPDNNGYWLEISGLTPGQEYRFQYHVMPDDIRIADPYAAKVLDYWNDPWISEDVYPNLIDFPVEFTGNNAVSVLETGQSPFNWTDTDFERPSKDRLVIYELLVRDFVDDHNIATVADTLDYLERLGVNAIQLMPIMEFEGNESWGYNPAFFFAPDKYYGTADAYKSFVNECHERGIAVILDIALNHSFGQNPQVRLWFDPNAGDWGEPSSQNPFFNQTPTHDFNVGYDYNHESPVTRAFSKRILEYWIEEFHVDGYRMDLSKGFTQNYTLGNIGAWGAYDQSRVDILTDYANHVWSTAPGAYMILEHFADNGEETALSNLGFMLWGNHNHDFSEAAMGYSSSFNWASYQVRGWNDPHLVAYAESHDEERLMYKNLLYGSSNGSYDITQLETALARQEMTHVFLLSIPGPKMLWQFGELGYDYSINHCPDGTINEDCRTAPKPIRWDYQDNSDRDRLYRITAAVAKLKREENAFATADFSLDVGGTGKRIHLNHPEMDVVVVGNFDVVGFNMSPGFQHTGTWYDYFTGEAFEVNDQNVAFYFEPGEYHIYTDQPLETPVLETGLTEIIDPEAVVLWPNPSADQFSVNLSAFAGSEVSIELIDLTGRTCAQLYHGPVTSYRNQLILNIPEGIDNGTYLVSIINGTKQLSARLMIQR